MMTHTLNYVEAGLQHKFLNNSLELLFCQLCVLLVKLSKKRNYKTGNIFRPT